MIKVNIYFCNRNKQLICMQVLECDDDKIKEITVLIKIVLVGAELPSASNYVKDVLDAIDITKRYVRGNSIKLFSENSFTRTYMIDYTNGRVDVL